MKSMKAFALILTVALPLAACGDDGVPSESEGTTGDDDDDTTTNMTTSPSTTVNPSTTATTTTEPPTTGETDTPTTTGETETPTTTGETETPTTTGETESTTTGDTGDTEMMTTTGLLECADEDLGTGAPLEVMGDNTGSGDDIDLSCSGAGGGEEYIYEFTTAEAGVYTFDTLDTDLDTALGVLDGCGGTELFCNDDAGAFTFPSFLVTQLEADTTYVVAVDSYDGAVGAYTLDVNYHGSEGMPDQYCDAAGDALGTCETAGGGTQTYGGTLHCSDLTYYDVFEIAVTAGDCVALAADNIDPVAGATGNEAPDLRMWVIDANGDFSSFDDEVDCTDPTFGGDYGCPSAIVTASSTGTMLVAVGQWGGDGCPVDGPYSLDVAINGTDLDISAGPTIDDRLGLCL